MYGRDIHPMATMGSMDRRNTLQNFSAGVPYCKVFLKG